MARFRPTRFMAEDSKYNKKSADYAVSFIECLRPCLKNQDNCAISTKS
ncbi:MAG: hypothetical protein MR378_00945 [Ruminococcus sp.]|nr:hypothetical protein [Ruminococcus sp.]